MSQAYYIVSHFIKPDGCLATAWELTPELELDLDVAEALVDIVLRGLSAHP